MIVHCWFTGCRLTVMTPQSLGRKNAMCMTSQSTARTELCCWKDILEQVFNSMAILTGDQLAYPCLSLPLRAHMSYYTCISFHASKSLPSAPNQPHTWCKLPHTLAHSWARGWRHAASAHLSRPRIAEQLLGVLRSWELRIEQES